MATIVTRAAKGTPLTHVEVDANFTNLNSDKAEVSSLGTAAATASTDYATAAQGALADTATQPAEVVAKTSATGSAVIPTGTTGQQDGSPSAGYLRFNTTETSFEGYDGSAWGAIGGSSGGVVEFADGSNSAPSVTNTGNLNTGLYFPAADQVGLTAGGTQRLNVSATGIDVTGTVTATGTSVFASLDISGDIDVDGTANLDILDVDGAANFAADVTFADGADIITASAGTSNFRAGVNAGNSIESGGNYNVVVGDEAGTAITTADNNVAVGFEALKTLATSSQNTAVGHTALKLNTAANNSAFGYGALAANTTGTNNTALGRTALTANTTANDNTAVGYAALYANTTGPALTAIGTYALANNTTGSSNTAAGFYALISNTTGNDNTAVGRSVMQGNNTGYSNVAIGGAGIYTAAALQSNTTGYGNIAIGAALTGNTTGTQNVAIGRTAMYSSSTASGNVAIGQAALTANTTGGNNTALGMNALQSLTTGTGNVAVGNASGGQATMINITTENDRAVFGNNSTTNAYVKVAWTVTSDARDKTNIKPVPHGLDFVQQLNPVSYNFKKSREDDTPHGNKRYGFLAQDILALEGDDNVIIDNEQADHLKYQGEALVPVLVKAIQEQQATITALTARITALEGA